MGRGRDAEELKKITLRPAKEILQAIVAAADKFADGVKQHDDMTMIVVRGVQLGKISAISALQTANI